MAENKKSFILYADLKHTLAKVPDDVAGKLFKIILEYVNDNNPTIEDDLLLEVLFEPIKQTLKRDLIRWEEFRKKQSANGSKGGRPIKQVENEEDNKKAKESEINPKNPSLNLESQKSLSANVSVNDSVNVIENVIVSKVNNIDSRKLKFASTLEPYLPIYGKELLNDFYKYWTEPNKSNTKFRQELEKTWSVERRLETWSKNERKKVAPKKESEPTKSKVAQAQETYERLHKKIYGNDTNTNESTAISN